MTDRKKSLTWVNNITLTTILKHIKAKVGSPHPNNERLTKYSHKFNKLSEADKLELLRRVIKSQGAAIRYGMENQHDISLVRLGRFRRKNTRQIVLQIKREVLEELGVEDYHKADEETRQKVEDIVNSRKTEAFKKHKEEKGYLFKSERKADTTRNSKKIDKSVFRGALGVKKAKK